MSLLLAVVEAGSLSGAARRIGMPLASVSRKISDLEAHLKTRLFNRTTRRIALTDAGRSYVEACRRILDDLGEAERAATGEYSAAKGEIAIAAPIVFGRLHVLPIVTDFLAAYPDIDIGMQLSDSVTHLLDEHIDIGVRIGVLPDFQPVGDPGRCDPSRGMREPGRPRTIGTPDDPQALANVPCVTFIRLSATDRWMFRKDEQLIEVPIRSRLRVNTAEAAIDAATAGIGFVRTLSYQAAAALQSGTLRLVLEDFEPEPWPVHLVYPGQGRLPIKLRAFLDFATPRLRARTLGDSVTGNRLNSRQSRGKLPQRKDMRHDEGLVFRRLRDFISAYDAGCRSSAGPGHRV